MALPRTLVLQTIEKGKQQLGIEDVIFDVRQVEEFSKIGKRAEIFIWSEVKAEIVLYPDASLFSVHHELCHVKLFRMGFPLTNTEKDQELFPDSMEYLSMVVIAEWYINELQKQVFREFYAVDRAGTPRPPPFSGLPKLPVEKFSSEEMMLIARIARQKGAS